MVPFACRPVNGMARVLSLILLAVAMVVTSSADAQQRRKVGIPKKADDRVIADSRSYPWTAVGRLNRAGGRGHCTATIVAPKVVLTAAHCLWDKRQWAAIAPDKVHFVAGWQRGEYLFHSIATAVHVSPRWKAEKANTLGGAQHDWAIVILENDPSPTTGVIKVAPFNRKNFWNYREAKVKFTQGGYSGDRGHVLTMHEGCPLWGFVKGPNLAIHNCDVVPGDSGSPIIFKDAKTEQYWLVGIHVVHTPSRVVGSGYAVPSMTFINSVKKLAKKVE